MQEHIVEEHVEETPDTSEIEAAYLQARDTYVVARDAYSMLQREGAETNKALEDMLSEREKYVAAYTSLMLVGVRPAPPPQDPRFISRDRTPHQEKGQPCE